MFPFRLNLADLPTRASEDPINLINSVWYSKATTYKWNKMADVLRNIKHFNTFQTVENRKLKYTIRSTETVDEEEFSY